MGILATYTGYTQSEYQIWLNNVETYTPEHSIDFWMCESYLKLHVLLTQGLDFPSKDNLFSLALAGWYDPTADPGHVGKPFAWWDTWGGTGSLDATTAKTIATALEGVDFNLLLAASKYQGDEQLISDFDGLNHFYQQCAKNDYVVDIHFG